MIPTITPVYAALLALVFLVLSVRVIRVRRGAKIALGDGEDKTLLSRTRAHGNFAEYTPLALVLILMVEMQGGPGWLIHGLGVLLLAGRIAHPWGLTREPKDFRGRVAGMMMTFFALGIGALANLWLALV